MTARASTLGPVVVAESAAEAVRMLNHLTLAHPSAGNPIWEDVADLCRVLTEVMVLAVCRRCSTRSPAISSSRLGEVRAGVTRAPTRSR